MFKLKQHTIGYLILATILIISVISVLIFNFNSTSIKIITFFLATGYTVWGVTHHKKAGHVDQKIMLEYAGISALALVIIYSIIR